MLNLEDDEEPRRSTARRHAEASPRTAARLRKSAARQRVCRGRRPRKRLSSGSSRLDVGSDRARAVRSAETPAAETAGEAAIPRRACSRTSEGISSATRSRRSATPTSSIRKSSASRSKGVKTSIAGLRAGEPLELVREPANPHDPNAIEVRYGNLQLGFLRRRSRGVSRRTSMPATRYGASVTAASPAAANATVGVNMHVSRVTGASARVRRGRDRQRTLEAEPTTCVRIALIGERPLRDAQRAVLERVAGRPQHAGGARNGPRQIALLSIACGARRALARARRRWSSIRCARWPTISTRRSCAASRRSALRMLRANGSIDGDEREALDRGARDGAWDIVLATPDSSHFHASAFARACNRPALVVVDEAHHLFESTHRPAYGALGDARRVARQSPQVLALTATADERLSPRSGARSGSTPGSSTRRCARTST